MEMDDKTRAYLIRFIDTQVRAFIKENIKNILNEVKPSYIEDVLRNLREEKDKLREDISTYINWAKREMITLKSARFAANKANHELKNIFSLVRKINARIEKFYEKKK